MLSQENDESGVRVATACIEELKLSCRFVSGGERSDDTLNRLSFFVGGDEDAIVDVVVVVKVSVEELANNGSGCAIM